MQGGHILEVVVCKYWTSLGSADVSISVSLDGLRPSAPSLAMTAAEVLRLDVTDALRATEMAAPVVVLRGQLCSYRLVRREERARIRGSGGRLIHVTLRGRAGGEGEMDRLSGDALVLCFGCLFKWWSGEWRRQWRFE